MLVTIATYSYLSEAYIARAKLESEGIDVLLADEHTVSMNWLLSNAIGGIRLQVNEEDVTKAVEILESIK